jgi:hypothetical protein
MQIENWFLWYTHTSYSELHGDTVQTRRNIRGRLKFFQPFLSATLPRGHQELLDGRLCMPDSEQWPLTCNLFTMTKGQLISKTNCLAEDSPKKRTNEFIFTSMRRVFVRFLGESSARKKRFEIYIVKLCWHNLTKSAYFIIFCV